MWPEEPQHRSRASGADSNNAFACISGLIYVAIVGAAARTRGRRAVLSDAGAEHACKKTLRASAHVVILGAHKTAAKHLCAIGKQTHHNAAGLMAHRVGIVVGRRARSKTGCALRRKHSRAQHTDEATITHGEHLIVIRCRQGQGWHMGCLHKAHYTLFWPIVKSIEKQSARS